MRIEIEIPHIPFMFAFHFFTPNQNLVLRIFLSKNQSFTGNWSVEIHEKSMIDYFKSIIFISIENIEFFQVSLTKDVVWPNWKKSRIDSGEGF